MGCMETSVALSLPQSSEADAPTCTAQRWSTLLFSCSELAGEAVHTVMEREENSQRCPGAYTQIIQIIHPTTGQGDLLNTY